MFIVNLEVMIKSGIEFFGKPRGAAIAPHVETGGESK
jgi:hypothetical protein